MALVSESPPPADTERPPWPWWAAIVAGVALFIVLGLLISIVAGLAGWTGDLPDRAVLGATLVQDVALIALAVWIAQTTGPAPLFHLGVRRTPPARAAGLAVGAFVAFFVFLVVWQQVIGTNKEDDLAQELGANDSAFNLVLVTVLVCLFAPVGEELFFRGLLFGGLRKAIGWIGAAIVSGLVFGVVHAGGTDVVFLLPLAVLGAALCWLYKRTGSLIPGMGVHAFNNALALGVTLHWEAWQVLLAVVLAPAIVVGLVTLVAVPAAPPPPPAPPAPPAPPEFMPPVAPQLPAR
jgi:membrane protease YdiL (CAAX protease family)